MSQNKQIKLLRKKELRRTHGKILTPVNSWWWLLGYQLYSFLCVIVKLGNDAGDAGQRDGEPFLVLTLTVKHTDIHHGQLINKKDEYTTEKRQFF